MSDQKPKPGQTDLLYGSKSLQKWACIASLKQAHQNSTWTTCLF